MTDGTDLNQEKENLQEYETKWLESLDELKSSKNENINKDLFSTLEYLKSCDHFFKNSSIELKKISEQLTKFTELKKKQKGNGLTSIDELINQLKDLKINLLSKLENLFEEYSILSEETLRKTQDIIAKIIESRSNNVSLEKELNQDIDPKLFLQELRDSLEDYRQAREESVSEFIMEEIRKLPDNSIPEDLGEEAPQIDPILSQLDTAITECDSALIISESSETE